MVNCRYTISVPQNQQRKVTFPLEELIEKLSIFDLSTINENDAELIYLKEVIHNACQQDSRPKMIEVDADAAITELYIIFNGKKINAKQFFSAWEAEGLYFGAHQGTLLPAFRNLH